MNLLNMRSFFRSITNIETNLVTDADLDILLNKGREEVVAETDMLEGSNTQDVVDGTSGYTLPADFKSILAVYHDSVPLLEISQQDLDMQYSNWKADEGTPWAFFVDAGLTQVRLYPTPDTDSTNGLVVEYVQSANTLTATTDVPNMQQNYHHIPCYYAAQMAYMRLNDEAMVDRWERKFAIELEKAHRKVNHPSKTMRNIKRPHAIRSGVRSLNLGRNYPPYPY